ncbi:hypothetical protein ABGB07_36030 [Micromonosporaceae bacterium B7E4]
MLARPAAVIPQSCSLSTWAISPSRKSRLPSLSGPAGSVTAVSSRSWSAAVVVVIPQLELGVVWRSPRVRFAAVSPDR